jgi:hypothetical protein
MLDAASVYGLRTLQERIKQRVEEYTLPMIRGQMEDYAAYRERGGYLKALGEVLDWIDRIDASEDQRSGI